MAHATLVLLVSLSGSLAFQDGAPPAKPAEEAPRLAPEGAYVLELADGRMLRVRAKETDSGWQVRRNGAWLELGAGAVQRATPESELLREARRLQHAAGADPTQRVAYADWCLGKGLVVEGLEELDRVLTTDPDQPSARALLERAQPPVALPEIEGQAGAARRASLARVASAGPAVRELALLRVAQAAELSGLKADLAALLVDQSPRARSFAALGLRRLFRGEEVLGLLRRAVLDASDDVRTQAALALRDVGEPALIQPVLRALGSRSPAVRSNAVEALGRMGYRAAVEPLYAHLVALQGSGTSGPPRASLFVGNQFAYVQDYDVEVAQGAAIADPVINVGLEGAALEGAVVGVQDVVVLTERAAVRTALERLTGAEPGNTTQAWVRWWNEHGNEWGAAANPGAPSSYPASRER